MDQYIACLEKSIVVGLPNRHVYSLLNTVRETIERNNPSHFVLVLCETGARIILDKSELTPDLKVQRCTDAHPGEWDSQFFVYNAPYLDVVLFEQAQEYAERFL